MERFDRRTARAQQNTPVINTGEYGANFTSLSNLDPRRGLPKLGTLLDSPPLEHSSIT